MNSKKRSVYDLAIDKATARDTIKDADLSTLEVVCPSEKNHVAIKINLKDETLDLCKKIAAIKHFNSYLELIDDYIRNGIDQDKKILEKV